MGEIYNTCCVQRMKIRVPVHLTPPLAMGGPWFSNTPGFPVHAVPCAPLISYISYTRIAHTYPSLTSWRNFSPQKLSLNHCIISTLWHMLLENLTASLQGPTQQANTLCACMNSWSISINIFQQWNRLANDETKSHLSFLFMINL